MTVTFLTNRTDHQVHHPQIQLLNLQQVSQLQDLLKLSGSDSTEEIDKRFKGWLVLGHDIENRGEPNKGQLLLSSFHWGNDHVLVIDNTSIPNSAVFTPEILKRCFFIAHNADHEAIWGTATGFMPMRYGCTMVTGKRLYSGKEGYKHDLISEINRWLGNDAVPIHMDKDIRNEFATCEFFENKHILYNAGDSIKLKAMYEAQLQYADKLGQTFLVNSLCSRIIKPIAWTETKGIKHNTPKWLDIAKERQEKADKVCETLNNMVSSTPGVNMEVVNPALVKERLKWENRRSKEQKRKEKLELQLKNLEEKNKTHLKSYQTQKKQLEKLSVDLLQEISHTTSDINWSSQKQVLKVFEQMSIPLPLGKDKKTHQMKPGVGKEARAAWLINNQDSIHTPFMEQFDKYKKLIHNVHSFGGKWVHQYVKEGRAYTKIDQAGTTTGRFSSGNRKQGLFNAQQIPSPKEYRECFVADEGRALITVDYKACEGIIMASLAEDLTVKAILDLPDMHSYFGTKCYRAIYANRYMKTGDPKWKQLSETYEMNKTNVEKEKERHKFKNSAGLFPVAYGIFATKVANTAQITVEEGQICIDVIKNEVPRVISFLENKAKKATENGYVIHNTRTNSRRWFTPILDHKHYDFPIDKSTLLEVEAASRNSPIQGTNSDIVREAMCMIDLWANLFKQDCKFVLQVHDELIYDVPFEKKEWFLERIMNLMKRAAKNYLMKEIDMECDGKFATYWNK